MLFQYFFVSVVHGNTKIGLDREIGHHQVEERTNDYNPLVMMIGIMDLMMIDNSNNISSTNKLLLVLQVY